MNINMHLSLFLEVPYFEDLSGLKGSRHGHGYEGKGH